MEHPETSNREACPYPRPEGARKLDPRKNLDPWKKEHCQNYSVETGRAGRKNTSVLLAVLLSSVNTLLWPNQEASEPEPVEVSFPGHNARQTR